MAACHCSPLTAAAQACRARSDWKMLLSRDRTSTRTPGSTREAAFVRHSRQIVPVCDDVMTHLFPKVDESSLTSLRCVKPDADTQFGVKFSSDGNGKTMVEQSWGNLAADLGFQVCYLRVRRRIEKCSVAHLFVRACLRVSLMRVPRMCAGGRRAVQDQRPRRGQRHARGAPADRVTGRSGHQRCRCAPKPERRTVELGVTLGVRTSH